MGSLALLLCLLAAPVDPDSGISDFIEPDDAGVTESTDAGGAVAMMDAGVRVPDAGADVKIIPVLAPAYTPELSFLINAGGVLGWNTPGSPRSSFTLIAGGSTIGAFIAQARLTSYLLEDRLRLSAFVDVRDQPDHYFGVGFVNGFTRPQGPDTTAYRRTSWHVAPVLQVRMKEGLPLFFGAHLEHTGTFSRNISAGMEADSDFQDRGGAKVINSGLGFSLTWDSRDVPINPRHGLFLSAQWMGYGSWFLGNTQWSAFSFDYRQTVTLVHEGTLNWQVKYRTAIGDAPWTDLTQLGTPWDLRAYRWGRYRDTSAGFAVVEFRYMLPFKQDTIWARLGVAGWVGVGAMGHGVLPNFLQLLPAIGVGLRVRLQDRANVRIDFGIGRDSFAFYFQFLEAF